MFDIHQLAHSEEFDHEEYHRYAHALSQEFAMSPEADAYAEKFDTSGYSEMMLGFAGDYLGVTPPEMSPRDMKEILFELFPRKISTEPENAPAIVAELRAFWLFVQRQFDLKNAAAILTLLNDDAATKLKRDLADPRNFGMAKSFMMQGKSLGFDMTTQAGLNTFMNYYNSSLANRPPMIGPIDDADEDDLYVNDFDDGFEPDLPPPGPTAKERADQRKKKRKAQRQARKQGRQRR